MNIKRFKRGTKVSFIFTLRRTLKVYFRTFGKPQMNYIGDKKYLDLQVVSPNGRSKVELPISISIEAAHCLSVSKFFLQMEHELVHLHFVFRLIKLLNTSQDQTARFNSYNLKLISLCFF